MQEEKRNSLKMSFLAYYEYSGTLRILLRDRIIEVLEISLPTFYNKLKDDTWSTIERQKIDEVYHEHVVNTLSEILGIPKENINLLIKSYNHA